jgi:hypothetical protein
MLHRRGAKSLSGGVCIAIDGVLAAIAAARDRAAVRRDEAWRRVSFFDDAEPALVQQPTSSGRPFSSSNTVAKLQSHSNRLTVSSGKSEQPAAPRRNFASACTTTW